MKVVQRSLWTLHWLGDLAVPTRRRSGCGHKQSTVTINKALIGVIGYWIALARDHENSLRGTRTHTKKRAAAECAVFSPLSSSGRGDQPVFATVRVRLQSAFVSGWRGRPEGLKRRLGGGPGAA